MEGKIYRKIKDTRTPHLAPQAQKKAGVLTTFLAIITREIRDIRVGR